MSPNHCSMAEPNEKKGFEPAQTPSYAVDRRRILRTFFLLVFFVSDFRAFRLLLLKYHPLASGTIKLFYCEKITTL